MKNTWQVILAGEGGQGLIVGGRILARAAILEGKNVVQTQSYGISARGGYSEAQVIISDREIYYPKCDNPNVVLALNQTAYDRYRPYEDCLIIYERDVVTALGAGNEISYPFNRTTLDLGRANLINMLFLGVILKNVSLVQIDSMLQAIREQFPRNFENNMRAFQVGLES